MPTSDVQGHQHQTVPEMRRRLRWRARRGLLENDLVLERFFAQREETLSDADVAGLDRLLDLSDNDLMDYIMGRKEPEGELAADRDVKRVLHWLREA